MKKLSWADRARISNRDYLAAIRMFHVNQHSRNALAKIEQPELRALVANEAIRHGLPVGIIVGPCRKMHLVKARKSIALKARAQGFSYPVIGRALNRDHTTIMHAVGAV